MDDRGGQRFGRYEILSELGRGAMGVVYKARDPRINRLVAVKTISLIGQSVEDELDYRERFFREAEAAGRLSHPGIVTVFDVGEEAETRAPYIVMEYVGGESLERLLARKDRKIPVETALRLTMEIAEALDAAHCMNVVHRDLKPANILLTEDGRAKIADFGVAKLNFANQTSAGRAWGTPAYMSPEQVNGDVVDGRSDLFSLGVILYTSLTGHRPFQGNSAVTVSYKVVNRDPIPATLLDTELPPGLDYIITRAMAKDARDRYQRGMELVLDIQSLQQGRAPWSKTEQAGSSDAAIAEQIAKAKVRPSSLNHKTLTYQATKTQSQSLRLNASADVKRAVIQKVLIGVWVLVGMLVLGLAAISLNRRVMPARPVASLPQSEPVLKLDTTPPVATRSSSVPRIPLLEKSSAVVARAHPVSLRDASLKRLEMVPNAKAAKNDGELARSAIVVPSPAALDVSLPNPASVVSLTTLGIEVEHRFPSAYLTIWVDGQMTYTHLLFGNDKKTLGMFHHVAGHEFHATQIAAGHHHLRIQITAAAGAGSPAFDGSASIEGDLANGRENTLHVTFAKNGDMILALK